MLSANEGQILGRESVFCPYWVNKSARGVISVLRCSFVAGLVTSVLSSWLRILRARSPVLGGSGTGLVGSLSVFWQSARGSFFFTPRRVHRLTLSRGPMVRKKKSRDQLETGMPRLWVQGSYSLQQAGGAGVLLLSLAGVLRALAVFEACIRRSLLLYVSHRTSCCLFFSATQLLLL